MNYKLTYQKQLENFIDSANFEETLIWNSKSKDEGSDYSLELFENSYRILEHNLLEKKKYNSKGIENLYHSKGIIIPIPYLDKEAWNVENDKISGIYKAVQELIENYQKATGIIIEYKM